ncbi:MAG: hypothetical protein QXG39_02215 [Candidatus Aenigmatarchaeota archaeon]
MGKSIFMFSLLIFFLCGSGVVCAFIYTCDSEGLEKINFYTNETVYVASSSNITNESKTFKFYVLRHGEVELGVNLTSKAIILKDVTTNSSGFVTLNVLWSQPVEGNYDLVVDMNDNQTFDSEDLIYDAEGEGFFVLEEPVPVLTISKGENSPEDHEWHKDMKQENEMLQIKIETGSYEDVEIKSFVLFGKGEGDDKNGIKYVVACEDKDGSGICEFGEKIIGSGKFTKDDGIVVISPGENFYIPANSSFYVVFYYVMNKSSSFEGTYGFELGFVDASGVISKKKAVLNGLPINSAVKNVVSRIETQTTTTSTTTTTLPQTTTTLPQTREEEEKKINFIIGLALAGFAVVVILLIFYFFFLKPSTQIYRYKPK